MTSTVLTLHTFSLMISMTLQSKQHHLPFKTEPTEAKETSNLHKFTQMARGGLGIGTQVYLHQSLPSFHCPSFLGPVCITFLGWQVLLLCVYSRGGSRGRVRPALGASPSQKPAHQLPGLPQSEASPSACTSVSPPFLSRQQYTIINALSSAEEIMTGKLLEDKMQ